MGVLDYYDQSSRSTSDVSLVGLLVAGDRRRKIWFLGLPATDLDCSAGSSGSSGSRHPAPGLPATATGDEKKWIKGLIIIETK